MKLVFVSNFFNEHVKPISLEWNNSSEIEEFYFVESELMGNDRKEIGFADQSLKYDFILKLYHNKQRDLAINKIMNADVTIFDGLNYEWIKDRLNQNKVTFIVSERYLKKGLWYFILNFKFRKSIKDKLLRYKDAPVYYLTIGAYLPYELFMLGFPKTKMFQWAYFPEVHLIQNHREEHGKKIRLIWVGRMIKMKRPIDAICIAKKLKKRNVEFELIMIGDGAQYENVKRKIKREQLENSVQLIGKCEPSLTQEYMAQSDIFLFTSDYWEGWGATLSETMELGVVPIASYKAGASRIIIKHGNNGFIYNNIEQAADYIEKIIRDKNLRNQLVKSAKNTFATKWSAKTATGNFLKIAQEVLDDNIITKFSSDEPMAQSRIIKAKNYINTRF